MSYEPAVYAGAPKDTNGYEHSKVNGLEIYLPKDAAIAKEGMEIDLVGQSFWKRLAVKGLNG